METEQQYAEFLDQEASKIEEKLEAHEKMEFLPDIVRQNLASVAMIAQQMRSDAEGLRDGTRTFSDVMRNPELTDYEAENAARNHMFGHRHDLHIGEGE